VVVSKIKPIFDWSTPQVEISKRYNALEYFIREGLGLSGAFVTDESTINDFLLPKDEDARQIIVEQIYRVYGTRLESKHKQMPLWKLLDKLEENCLKSELDE
jgi:hypothetical protein